MPRSLVWVGAITEFGRAAGLRTGASRRVGLLFWAVLVGCFGIPALARAQAPSGSAEAQPAAAASAETIPWQPGPKSIDLGHELTLDLTDRFAFLERERAAKLLERNGSLFNDNLLGLVIGTQPEDDWLVVIRYDDEGYVKDNETIDANELLKALRDGQAAANEARQKRGFEALNIEGWQEPPHYEKSLHHLVWGLNVLDKAGTTVNYNTRVLGRRGYASLNLVTDSAKLAAHEPMAALLLANTKFRTGARYEDFDGSSDKVAEYGLGGLVLAGAGLTAAKLVKVGLLAKFWKLLLVAVLAGKKFLIVALIAGAALVRSLLERKRVSTSNAGKSK